jgi:hypothetical protein
MNGPEYFAAAQAALAKAQGAARIIATNPDVLFDQQLRLFEANAAMARLALDVARAAASGDLSDAAEIYSDATQDRTDALHANYAAWVAAVTEGGAR